MYGTVARIRLKPGTEEQFRQLGQEYDNLHIPGYVGDIVYRTDADSNEYFMAVLFESKETYHTNAASSDQHQRYERMRALMAADPEWHDGEIVFNSMKTASTA